MLVAKTRKREGERLRVRAGRRPVAVALRGAVSRFRGVFRCEASACASVVVRSFAVAFLRILKDPS